MFLAEGIQFLEPHIHETPAGDMPDVIVFGLLFSGIHRCYATTSALLTGMAEVDVIVADLATADARRFASLVAKSMCSWVGAKEKVSPCGAHFAVKERP